MKIKDFSIEYLKVTVAFSGGIDSAYLLYAAKQYAKEEQAYYVKSAFQPRFELEDATHLAEELGVKMKIINLDILSDENIVSNPHNRCYYCKKRISHQLYQKPKRTDLIF
ncbi:MAG: 7-cyano-7-deazaguanine synthase [Lachnospiraceae bacterium]|nr:7-cyano-7-deazaguanine synthase [Lachnospiraceae bacterium]